MAGNIVCGWDGHWLFLSPGGPCIGSWSMAFLLWWQIEWLLDSRFASVPRFSWVLRHLSRTRCSPHSAPSQGIAVCVCVCVWVRERESKWARGVSFKSDMSIYMYMKWAPWEVNEVWNQLHVATQFTALCNIVLSAHFGVLCVHCKYLVSLGNQVWTTIDCPFTGGT